MKVSELGTILGIWAHPDDEVVLSGGIMATAVKNGQRVVVVTATKGEEGESDEWPREALGNVRAKELHDSLRILGVREHYFLGCWDGKCSQVPSNVIGSQIRAIIKEVKPDTILTFGPDGWSGHPDHCAVSAWATQALALAGLPKTRLFYVAVTADWLAKFGPDKHPEPYFDKDLKSTAEPDLAINFTLSDEVWHIKSKAIQAHASQIGTIRKGMGEDFLQPENQTECFCLAEPV